ncbi:hypothetical protein BDF22DRAFT_774405 [Syncephalis plumigaleata]|nr:hypothetical protein BDF22DRAFT_774405 [Syncephalis plumigaleata]
MDNTAKAVDTFIRLLEDTSYPESSRITANMVEWAFADSENAKSAGAALCWLTQTVDSEENVLTSEELQWQHELTAIERDQVFQTSLREERKQLEQLEKTLDHYKGQEHRLDKQYKRMVRTLDELAIREDELHQHMQCLELELNRHEDTSIDSASLWLDRELQETVEAAKNRIEDMDIKNIDKKYLFHCREELGRVAKVNERFTGRVEQLLQQQFTKAASTGQATIQHMISTPELEVLGPTLEQRNMMDDGYGNNNSMELNSEQEVKLKRKLAQNMSNTCPELKQYLMHQTQQQIHQPLMACSNAWSITRKEYRIERLEMIIGLLLEQHVLHQLLAAAFELEQQQVGKCQSTIAALSTQLNQWTTIYRQRVSRMQGTFYSGNKTWQDNQTNENGWMSTINELLVAINELTRTDAAEHPMDCDDILSEAIYTTRSTMCSTASSLLSRLEQVKQQVSQTATEMTNQWSDLQQAKNTLVEIQRRFSATHDIAEYPKNELNRVIAVRQTINKLRPRLADITKNQSVSNLLQRRHDMFCQFLLDSDDFIASHQP